MSVNANMKISEVAQAMNKGEQFVRIGLQEKRFPFGSAVYNEERKCWNYHIPRASFCLYQYGYIPENLKTKEGETNEEK